MNRIQRLYRSAIGCGVIVIFLLLFTVPASRANVEGHGLGPMVTLLVLIGIVGGIGVFFVWLADRLNATLAP